jgi:predicted deacetylase
MKSLVVSLHDVSPLTKAMCEEILVDLSRVGVHQTSLLIIPNHHGLAPVTKDKSFQSWLKEKIDGGHEPVLHGYFHQRRKRETDRWVSRLTTEIYTAGEGEFYDLTFDLAAKFLRAGFSDLAFLPREVVGFVAPAWLLSDAAERAVQAAGFSYTTRVRYVRIFKPLHEFNSRSLVWSTRAAWRVAGSLFWNQVLAIAKADAPLLRISIHPADLQQRPVWCQILKILAMALEERECVTYERLVERVICERSG